MFHFFAIIIITIVDHMAQLHFAPAVQKVTNTIHEINLYPMDSAILVSRYLSTK